MMDKIYLIFYLLKSPEVPVSSKLLPLIGIIYFISPLDGLPDWIIGLGILDDIAILILMLWLFIKVAPLEVLSEYQDLKEKPKKKKRSDP
ncbi:hypothetical protein MASR2M15_01400 [Anaerolineales bacterium]